MGVATNRPYLTSREGGADEGTTWSDYSSQSLVEGPWRMEYEEVNHIVYSANWGGGAWALKTNNPGTAMVDWRNAEQIRKDRSVNPIKLVKNKIVVKHMTSNGKIQTHDFNGLLIKE